MEILVRMDGRLDRVEERLDSIDERLDSLEERVGAVEERLGGMEERLRSVERSVAYLTEAVEDMQEQFAATSRAVDTDAVTIIDHEARIRQLEAVRAGMPV